jgi:hypothetical protein
MMSLPVMCAAFVGALILASSTSAEEAEEELEPGAAPESEPDRAAESAGEPAEEPAPAPEPAAEPLAIPLPGPMDLSAEARDMASQLPVDEPAVTEDQLRAAQVEYRTAWSRGIGFLVGDQRTVVVVGDLRDRYRRLTVRMSGGDGAEVRVTQVRRQIDDRFSQYVILMLENDLPGMPLDVGTDQPSVGTTVLILQGGGEPAGRMPRNTEVAAATVTAAGRYTLTLGATWNQVVHGSPVFNEDGQVVAFFGTSGFALRINELLAEVNHQADRQLATSVIGLRLGTEFGGFLEDPLTIEIEVGVALWDQLGIVFFLGGGLSTGSSMVVIDPVENVHEAGVGQGEHDTLFLGLELEYRLLLTRSAMPFYLDFAVGLNYTVSMLDFTGLAFYATEPGCDPIGEACGLTVGEPPSRDVIHAVGLSLGVDLRAGPFVISLRVIPDSTSYNGPGNVYRLNFGLSWR